MSVTNETPARGVFVTFEGGEGSGKSTQIKLLAGRLARDGIEAIVTREPGGSLGAEILRHLILSGVGKMLGPEAETLLFAAARDDHVRAVIAPSLARGQWVLCDRYVDASYAYQGGGRGQPEKRIAELERWACDGIKPDLTLLLDLPVSTGRARAAGRGDADRIEVEADAFFERVRGSYRQRVLAEPSRFRTLDASQSPALVLQAGTDALAELLAGEER